MTSKSNTADEAAIEAIGAPKVTQKELDGAKKDGILQAAKEDAASAYRFATDGSLLSGDGGGPKYFGSSDIMQFAPLLNLGIDAFKDRIKDDADNTVPLEKAAGLLELERSGQNRTDFVQALMKRLDVKSPYEVTTAGPDYTNDTTPTTAL